MARGCWRCRTGRCGCGTSVPMCARACCRRRRGRAPRSTSRCRLGCRRPGAATLPPTAVQARRFIRCNALRCHHRSAPVLCQSPASSRYLLLSTQWLPCMRLPAHRHGSALSAGADLLRRHRQRRPEALRHQVVREGTLRHLHGAHVVTAGFRGPAPPGFCVGFYYTWTFLSQTMCVSPSAGFFILLCIYGRQECGCM